MGREIKRVAVDFDAPLREVWAGYLMPDSLHETKCPSCKNGYSPDAAYLHDLWYGYVPFEPESTGSTRLTAETPAVRAFAERNVAHSPEYYGSGEWAIAREARRLANLWNGHWSHHLSQADVDALVAGNRLYDLTHTWSRDGGWQPKDPPVSPTAELVNTWSLSGFGHDSINASIVVRARCEREGLPVECSACEGHSTIEAYPGQRAEAEAWERTEPPSGEAYQMWETVSEGSPISPPFAAAAELALWMTQNKCTVNGPFGSVEAAMRFIDAGWAPSFVSTPETGLVDGATYAGMVHAAE